MKRKEIVHIENIQGDDPNGWHSDIFSTQQHHVFQSTMSEHWGFG